MINILFFSLFYLFVTPNQAHAYLDPGTGSYITQILIGFALGGLYMVKIFWHRIVKQFKSFYAYFKKDAKKTKKGN